MENKDKEISTKLDKYYCIPLDPEKYDYSQGHPCLYYGSTNPCHTECTCGECFFMRKDVRYISEGGAE